MADRPGVMLYFDIMPALEKLNDEQRGALLTAIMGYAHDGRLPALDPVTAMAWEFIKPKIDKDQETYNNVVLKREYATYCRDTKRSGETPVSFSEWKHHVISHDITWYPTTSSTPSTSTSSTSSTSTSSTTTTNKERGRGGAASPPDPPALADVVSYVKQQGLKMDPEAFMDYYAACGWMTPKGPVIDWKALARNWARREKKGNESDVKSNRLPGGKWHLQTDTGE